MLDSGHLPHGIKIRRHPQNRKYVTCRNAVRGGPSRCHRRHADKNLVNRPCGFGDMRPDRQTDRQTLITIFRTLPGEVIKGHDDCTTCFHWIRDCYTECGPVRGSLCPVIYGSGNRCGPSITISVCSFVMPTTILLKRPWTCRYIGLRV